MISLNIVNSSKISICFTPNQFLIWVAYYIKNKQKENFTCYEKYCSNFTTAKKISYELEKDPKLEELLNVRTF